MATRTEFYMTCAAVLVDAACIVVGSVFWYRAGCAYWRFSGMEKEEDLKMAIGYALAGALLLLVGTAVTKLYS